MARNNCFINLLRLLVFGLLLSAVGASAQIKAAEDLVEQTTARMLTLIEEAKVYVDEDPERFYVAVEELLNPVIDFQARYLRAPQAVAVLTTMVLAFVILALLSLLVSMSVSQLAANADHYQAQIEQLLQRVTASLPLDRLNIDPEAVTRPLSRLPEGSIGNTLVICTM